MSLPFIKTRHKDVSRPRYLLVRNYIPFRYKYSHLEKLKFLHLYHSFASPLALGHLKVSYIMFYVYTFYTGLEATLNVLNHFRRKPS